MKSVYSAVRAGSLNKAVCDSSLNGLKVTYSMFLIAYMTLFITFTEAYRVLAENVAKNKRGNDPKKATLWW
jgi:hypothetical protein